VTGGGLQRVTLQRLLERDGRTILWLTDTEIQYLYLELSGSLVRVNLGDPDLSPRAADERDHATDDPHLIEALHDLVKQGSAEIIAWAAQQCPPRAVIRHEDAIIDVIRAVRLPSDEVALFVGIKGEPDTLDAMHLAPFGEPEIADLAIARCETDDPSGEWQQQIIVRATVPEQAAGCCRLTFTDGEQTQSVWIRETSSRGTDQFSLARDFMPVAAVRAEIFLDVLQPLATALVRESAPGLVSVHDFGAEGEAQANLYVFAGADLEALHRTILGLSLTSRDVAMRVHVCVFDRTLLDQVVSAAQHWSEIYKLTLQVRCYSARSSEAQVVRDAWPTTRPSIYCRAGAVPHRTDWLTSTLQRLEAEQASFLLGAPGDPTLAYQDPSFWLNLLPNPSGDAMRSPVSALGAAAIAPNIALQPGLPRLFTLEAFVLAQASERGPITTLTEDLCFVSSGTMSQGDEFSRKLDLFSLQKHAKSPLAAGRRVRTLPGKNKR
jgi:hypothetical protein